MFVDLTFVQDYPAAALHLPSLRLLDRNSTCELVDLSANIEKELKRSQEESIRQ